MTPIHQQTVDLCWAAEVGCPSGLPQQAGVTCTIQEAYFKGWLP